MKTVKKSILIWYSPQEMYALVTDVARYPEFLPWCDRAAVLEQDAAGMTAEVGIAFVGIQQSFVTKNKHTAPHRVEVQLVKGPFSHLEGQWDFLPVGAGQQRACKVELSLSYGFTGALGKVLKPVFDKIAANMVDAFVQRAQKVYAESAGA